MVVEKGGGGVEPLDKKTTDLLQTTGRRLRYITLFILLLRKWLDIGRLTIPPPPKSPEYAT